MNSLKPYHDLEIDAHVTIDDALSKTTQEMGELLTAIQENNTVEIQKESADLLVNIISVVGHVGLEIPDNTSLEKKKQVFRGTTVWAPWMQKWERWAGKRDLVPLNAFGTFGDKSTEAYGEIAKRLPILLAEWHRHIAARRNKYSRDVPDENILTNINQELVSILLPLTQLANAEEVVQKCSEKFRSRVNAYIPKIDLRDYIQAHENFPKPGITFQDISPLLQCPKAMQFACFELAKRAKNADVIAGLDARGFLFGIPVAQILGKPFVMMRKKGKLPGKTIGTSYSLEYGESSIEIQEWAIQEWKNVVIIDDLLATGGTLLAATSLIEKIGGRVDGVLTLIWLDELSDHPLRQELNSYRNESIIQYS